MIKFKSTSLSLLAVAVLLVLFSVFSIQEGRHALLLKLGKLAHDSGTGKALVLGPGLHFKVPFINQAKVFDTRIQTLDIKSSRVVTKEKKDVIVDYYVKWRINDLPRYFKATGGNEFKAETLLEQKLNTALRAEFGKRTIADVVSGERDDVMALLKSRADESAEGLGIGVIDVRIKGIDLPSNTSSAIYQRMRADMEKIANRHRADGRAEAEAIRAGADAKVTVILAEAKSNGNKVRAKGQAKAANIYATAYSKDSEFFAFYRSLKAYQGTFNSKRDILVLKPNGQFFNYFNSAKASKDSN